MRQLVDNYVSPESSLGAAGVDELRWLRPVRPGDTLRVRVTVLEARRSNSKPDRGIVRSVTEVTNQDGETVMTGDRDQLRAGPRPARLNRARPGSVTSTCRLRLA